MKTFSSKQGVFSILMVVLGTYLLLFDGLLLTSRVAKSDRLHRRMDALPGALLFSLVVPSIINEGIWSTAAATLTALVPL